MHHSWDDNTIQWVTPIHIKYRCKHVTTHLILRYYTLQIKPWLCEVVVAHGIYLDDRRKLAKKSKI